MEINKFNYNQKVNLTSKNNSFKEVKKNLAGNQIKNNYFSPTTAQYLAFTGGYSLNLRETKNNLSSEDYPKDIEKSINETLEKGNKENKTLYDIHFEKYRNILDCYSLEDLKEQYSEFSDVKSVYDVDAKTGSYIDKYFKEELKEFSSDEDLTLSLIKLYWGQGFSLNDLSNFVEAQDGEKINLYYTMKKLNIPLMDKKYAHVLKLSNKEYNERFCEEMSQKLKEAKESRLQKAQGEPVVIPRGPLSDSHKKKISQGLKKYFSEHPERIYDMSQRQKAFLEENPQFKKEISIAMKYAWNSTQEGRSVKKHLSKFMKKHNRSINDEQLFLNTAVSSEEKNMLDAFWKKNPWAKKKFSIATTKGWQYTKDNMVSLFNQKENESVYLTFSTLPTEVKESMEKFAKNKYPTKEYEISKFVLYKGEKVQEGKRFNDIQKNSDSILKEYSLKHPRINNQLATSKHIALIKIKKDLEESSSDLPDSLKNNPIKQDIFNKLLESLFEAVPIYHNDPHTGLSKMPYAGVDVTLLDNMIINLMEASVMIDCMDFAQYYQDTIDFAWDYVKDDRINNIRYIFK